MRETAQVQRQCGREVKDDIYAHQHVCGPPKGVLGSCRTEELDPLEEDHRLDHHELDGVESDEASPKLWNRNQFSLLFN